MNTVGFRISVVILLGTLTGCGRKAEVESSITQLESAFPNRITNVVLQISIAAARNQDYVAGVVGLAHVKSLPGMTAEQLMAVEQASLAITQDLTRRADAGDAKARADLQQIEQTRSQ